MAKKCLPVLEYPFNPLYSLPLKNGNIQGLRDFQSSWLNSYFQKMFLGSNASGKSLNSTIWNWIKNPKTWHIQDHIHALFSRPFWLLKCLSEKKYSSFSENKKKERDFFLFLTVSLIISCKINFKVDFFALCQSFECYPFPIKKWSLKESSLI